MQLVRSTSLMAAISVCIACASGCSNDTAGSSKTPLDAGIDAQTTPDTSGADTGPSSDTGPGSDTGPTADTGPSADAGPGPDTGPDASSSSGFHLHGQLVPSGGLSLSHSFTLSGHLSPGHPPTKSTSASFQLELTPAHMETSP